MATPERLHMLGFFRSMTTAIAVLGDPSDDSSFEVPENPVYIARGIVLDTQTQTQPEVNQAPPIVPPQAPIAQVQAPPAPQALPAAPIAQVQVPHRRFGDPGASTSRGIGKGAKGIGKGGIKRHRKVLRDNTSGITNNDIRRLARRGGVKRLSGLIYEDVRGVLVDFLKNVIHDAVAYAEHAHRKTVSVMDVIYSMKRRGTPIYGFGA